MNGGGDDENGNNMIDGAGERLLQALRPGELGRPHALRADAPAFAPPCWWTVQALAAQQQQLLQL
eukprot:9066805-Alexandrium_andersonii.AAC.1